MYLVDAKCETSSAANAFGNASHSLIASTLTEESVIENVFKKDILKKVRKDTYVLYDLGVGKHSHQAKKIL